MRNELPADWVAVELNEVATIGPKTDVRDLPDAQLVHFVPMAAVAEDFGGMDTSQLRHFSEVRKGYTSFAEGDVLFAKITPCMENGKGGVVPTLPQKFAFGSTEFHVIRPSEAVTASWLAHFLSQPLFRRIARQNMTGSAGQLRVPTKWLASVNTPVPPLAEQTRIVAKLEELLSDLDAGVAELKAAQAKLTQYRQSLLKAAVEGALTADWRARRAALETVRPAQPGDAENRPRPAEFHASFAAGQRRRHETPPTGGCAVQEDSADGLETGAQLLARILTERRARWEARQLARFESQGKTPPKGWQNKYPEPVAPDTRDLPELPEGWVWATIGQCFQVAVGATPSRKIATYWKGEIPWVSSGEVQFRRITSTKESITKDGLNNTSTQVNPAGSVLLGMIGEGKTRGQVAILDTPAANNQNCAAIWVSETDVPPEYVYFWLWSRYNQTRKGSSGNNQPALNKSIVERIPIPLPPFREIREIVALLETQFSGIDKEADAIAHLLAQSAAQRQNLLKAAFSGQLVPQDPNDEPASVLLERVRAERVAGAAGKAPRGRRARETV